MKNITSAAAAAAAKEPQPCAWFQLMRGPAILSLSIMAIILPQIYMQLTTLSTQSLLLLASSIIGLLMTIVDIITYIQPRYQAMVHTIQKYGDDIILDDILKKVLSVDGWISCMWGSCVGTIFLYFLPIPKGLRKRIMRNVIYQTLGEEEFEEHIQLMERVIFQPGGIWQIISQPVGKSGISNDDNSSDDDKDLHSSNYNNQRRIVCNERDDDIVDTDLELTLNDGDDDESESDSFIGGEVEMNSPIQGSLLNNRDRGKPHSSSLNHNKAKSSSTNESLRDIDSAEKIAMDVLRQMCNSLLSHVHVDPQFQKVGSLAGIALFFQMRHSRVARRAIYSFVQGSTAFSLGCIIVGTVGSIQCKRKFIEWVLSSEDEVIKNNTTSSEKRRCTSSNRNSTGKSGNFRVLKKIIEVIVVRVNHDVMIKRRFQVAFAMMLLAFFRKSKMIRDGKRNY